jgi:hypothetical protein
LDQLQIESAEEVCSTWRASLLLEV